MTDAEIAGHMNWRGPGAYTAHAMKRIKRIIEEVQSRERESCAKLCDEMQDMVKKRRSFTGRGEDKKGRAKLTNQQADQIRKMDVSHSKLAAMFGVSQTTISRIKRGESY